MSHARARLQGLTGVRLPVVVGGARRMLAYRLNTEGAPPARLFAAHPAAAVPLPSTSDLRGFAPKVFDQRQTSGCWAHAAATCLVTSFAANDNPLPWVPSVDRLYKNARAAMLFGSGGPLTDTGTIPAIGIEALNKHGVMASRVQGDTDIDEFTINEAPAFIDLEDEHDVRPVDDAAIPDCSAGRPVADVMVDIAKATSGGIAVELGAWVDTAFFNWTPDQRPLADVNLADSAGGGHALACLGHRVTAYNAIELLIRSSWGTEWADQGEIWVAAPWVARAVVDIAAIAPRKAAP